MHRSLNCLSVLGHFLVLQFHYPVISAFGCINKQQISCSQRRMVSSHWEAGNEIINLDPIDLSKISVTRPQLAKDNDYAAAILNAWKQDAGERTKNCISTCSRIQYNCNDKDETSLYGCVYKSANLREDGISSVPGLILFHTGAGPQDMFLRWKADCLVNDEELFPDGCVVLIADIIGDGEGWAWTDRSRYETVRRSILVPDSKGERNELKCRVQAAIDTLSAQPNVDARNIAALGFCMGGHPILELARMQLEAVKVLVTYHGVFDGVGRLCQVKIDDEQANNIKPNILLCTGEDDPFIGKEDLSSAVTMFNQIGNCRVMTFGNTSHGFTNPAQNYNPSDAFAFNQDSYSKSWSATRTLLMDAFQ